jgi:hypothetical protein
MDDMVDKIKKVSEQASNTLSEYKKRITGIRIYSYQSSG